MTNFNAWREPWVAVRSADGNETLSLRDLFSRAHELAGLGADLTPLDVDSLMRFLPAVGACILQRADDSNDSAEAVAAGRYPTAAIERFEQTTDLSLFDLFGATPFLQRWDVDRAAIDALVNNKTKFLLHSDSGKSLLKPIRQLHPHEPGDTSIQWAVRRDTRNADSLAVLTQLLVTTWFQTKQGNAKDPLTGLAATKGSTGTWHVNPMAVYLVDPSNLGATLLANTPTEWLAEGRTAAFFDRAQDLTGIAANPLDLYRCTYAKTLPLLYQAEGEVLGFIIGPDTTIPVPVLGSDDKESLGAVHAYDHTRLYALDAKKGELVPRGAFSARLSSTEGFGRWFGADRKTGEAINRLKNVDRLYPVPENLTGWRLGVYSETSDGKGTRHWADWATIPARTGGGDPAAYAVAQTLLALVSKIRGAGYYGAKAATESGKSVDASTRVETAIYTSAYPVILEAVDAVERNPGADMRPFALRIAHGSVAAFTAATDLFATPQSVAVVANARAAFRRSVLGTVESIYPNPDSQKESA